MLRSVSGIRGFAIHATDGDLGTVDEFLFDDAQWTIRYLLDDPFAICLCPGALDVLEHLSPWGPTVILSDGDVVFQPARSSVPGCTKP